MQNCSGESGNNSCVPPPPPPSPAMPLKPSYAQTCKNQFSESRKSSHHDIVSAIRFITHHFNSENPATMISVYFPIKSIIQEGRCCGIVALSMASQLISETSVDDILFAAKSLNFTKEGEMFSAHNMATLAKSLLSCHAVVLNDLQDHKLNVLNHICDGNPVLVPYDADKNHFPCVNGGLSAHWAVVTGLCFSVSARDCPSFLAESEKISEFPELNVFVIKDKSAAKDLLQYAEKIFLYAHQGKSQHLAAWDLNDVVESNRNMFEVTKKYSSYDLVLPEKDYLSELRNKVVLLKRNDLLL